MSQTCVLAGVTLVLELSNFGVDSEEHGPFVTLTAVNDCDPLKTMS